MRIDEPAEMAGPAPTKQRRTWLLLGGAIAAEVSATLALRAAVTAPVWYLAVAIGYALGFTGLTLVLRTGMPVGVAYGIWAASGVALTAGLAAVLFGDNLNGLSVMGIALVVVGVLFVNFGSQRRRSASEQRTG